MQGILMSKRRVGVKEGGVGKIGGGRTAGINLWIR